MPRISLNISINNHTEIFKEHGGIFGKIPASIIGHQRIEKMIEQRVLQEIKKELPPVLETELAKRGINCNINLDEEE